MSGSTAYFYKNKLETFLKIKVGLYTDLGFRESKCIYHII